MAGLITHTHTHGGCGIFRVLTVSNGIERPLIKRDRPLFHFRWLQFWVCGEWDSQLRWSMAEDIETFLANWWLPSWHRRRWLAQRVSGFHFVIDDITSGSFGGFWFVFFFFFFIDGSFPLHSTEAPGAATFFCWLLLERAAVALENCF